MADRIANLAALLLAYVAFLPTIRENLPPAPYLTLSDKVVYMNMGACLVSLVDSFIQNEAWEDSIPKETKFVSMIITLAFACLLIAGSVLIVLWPISKYVTIDKPRYEKKLET